MSDVSARTTAVVLVAIALLLLPHSSAQSASGGPVVIGENIQLHSNILKQPRSLLISKPTGYDSSTERYPVLYLLDAKTHFQYTSGIVNFLAENDRMPKMLVVGIDSATSAERTHDLTPPSTDEIDNRFSPGNGGAEAFLSFVADELIPFVDRTYRTRPYRVLVGHSFGGLFTIYSLAARPQLFKAYIAADPSLYWNKEAIVTAVASVLSHTTNLREDLYVSVSDGSDEPPSAIRKLNTALSDRCPSQFRWHTQVMKDEDHASIPLPSIYRGLETIFEDWNLPAPLPLYDQGGIEAIQKRFHEAGERFGYPERKAPPFTISILVSDLMEVGRLEEASRVLLHDPAAYPPPWNQLDALARAYEKRGDAKNAIRYYRMSPDRNPNNAYARKKLTDSGIKPPLGK